MPHEYQHLYDYNKPWDAIQDLSNRVHKLENLMQQSLNLDVDKSLKDYLLTEQEKLDMELRKVALKYTVLHVRETHGNIIQTAEAMYQFLKGQSNGEKGKK